MAKGIFLLILRLLPSLLERFLLGEILVGTVQFSSASLAEIY